MSDKQEMILGQLQMKSGVMEYCLLAISKFLSYSRTVTKENGESSDRSQNSQSSKIRSPLCQAEMPSLANRIQTNPIDPEKLREEIRAGIKLKHVQTVDKSVPCIRQDGGDIPKIKKIPVLVESLSPPPPPPPPPAPPLHLNLYQPHTAPPPIPKHGDILSMVTNSNNNSSNGSLSGGYPTKNRGYQTKTVRIPKGELKPGDRDKLLDEIKQGRKLRTVQTLDKSKPVISVSNEGELYNPPPVVRPLLVSPHYIPPKDGPPTGTLFAASATASNSAAASTISNERINNQSCISTFSSTQNNSFNCHPPPHNGYTAADKNGNTSKEEEEQQQRKQWLEGTTDQKNISSDFLQSSSNAAAADSFGFNNTSVFNNNNPVSRRAADYNNEQYYYQQQNQNQKGNNDEKSRSRRNGDGEHGRPCQRLHYHQGEHRDSFLLSNNNATTTAVLSNNNVSSSSSPFTSHSGGREEEEGLAKANNFLSRNDDSSISNNTSQTNNASSAIAAAALSTNNFSSSSSITSAAASSSSSSNPAQSAAAGLLPPSSSPSSSSTNKANTPQQYNINRYSNSIASPHHYHQLPSAPPAPTTGFYQPAPAVAPSQNPHVDERSISLSEMVNAFDAALAANGSKDGIDTGGGNQQRSARNQGGPPRGKVKKSVFEELDRVGRAPMPGHYYGMTVHDYHRSRSLSINERPPRPNPGSVQQHTAPPIPSPASSPTTANPVPGGEVNSETVNGGGGGGHRSSTDEYNRFRQSTHSQPPLSHSHHQYPPVSNMLANRRQMSQPSLVHELLYNDEDGMRAATEQNGNSNHLQYCDSGEDRHSQQRGTSPPRFAPGTFSQPWNPEELIVNRYVSPVESRQAAMTSPQNEIAAIEARAQWEARNHNSGMNGGPSSVTRETPPGGVRYGGSRVQSVYAKYKNSNQKSGGDYQQNGSAPRSLAATNPNLRASAPFLSRKVDNNRYDAVDQGLDQTGLHRDSFNTARFSKDEQFADDEEGRRNSSSQKGVRFGAEAFIPRKESDYEPVENRLEYRPTFGSCKALATSFEKQAADLLHNGTNNRSSQSRGPTVLRSYCGRPTNSLNRRDQHSVFTPPNQNEGIPSAYPQKTIAAAHNHHSEPAILSSAYASAMMTSPPSALNSQQPPRQHNKIESPFLIANNVGSTNNQQLTPMEQQTGGGGFGGHNNVDYYYKPGANSVPTGLTSSSYDGSRVFRSEAIWQPAYQPPSYEQQNGAHQPKFSVAEDPSPFSSPMTTPSEIVGNSIGLPSVQALKQSFERSNSATPTNANVTDFGLMNNNNDKQPTYQQNYPPPIHSQSSALRSSMMTAREQHQPMESPPYQQRIHPTSYQHDSFSLESSERSDYSMLDDGGIRRQTGRGDPSWQKLFNEQRSKFDQQLMMMNSDEENGHFLPPSSNNLQTDVKGLNNTRYNSLKPKHPVHSGESLSPTDSSSTGSSGNGQHHSQQQEYNEQHQLPLWNNNLTSNSRPWKTNSDDQRNSVPKTNESNHQVGFQQSLQRPLHLSSLQSGYDIEDNNAMPSYHRRYENNNPYQQSYKQSSSDSYR